MSYRFKKVFLMFCFVYNSLALDNNSPDVKLNLVYVGAPLPCKNRFTRDLIINRLYLSGKKAGNEFYIFPARTT